MPETMQIEMHMRFRNANVQSVPLSIRFSQGRFPGILVGTFRTEVPCLLARTLAREIAEGQ